MKHYQSSGITFFSLSKMTTSYFYLLLKFLSQLSLPHYFTEKIEGTVVGNNFSHLPNGKSTIKPASVPIFRKTSSSAKSYSHIWALKSLSFWLLKDFTVSLITSPISYTNFFSTGSFLLAHENRFQLFSIY